MRMKYAAAFLLLLPVAGRAQTSAFGNYEVYSTKESNTSLGYLTTTLEFPKYLGNVELQQKGVMYERRTTGFNIASVEFDENMRLRLLTQGSNRIGFSVGDGSTDTVVSYFGKKNFKMYTVTFDFYSFGVASEFTYVYDRNKAITCQLALDLLNVGANLSMLEGGTIDKNFIAQINLIPFVIRPSVFFDLGRRGIGIALYINPYNVLEYSYAPNRYFSKDDIGVKFVSSRTKKYAVELVFVL